jgi:hypothetical protein
MESFRFDGSRHDTAAPLLSAGAGRAALAQVTPPSFAMRANASRPKPYM